MSSLLTGRRRPAAWLFALIVAGACTAGADRLLGPSLSPNDRALGDVTPATSGVVISQVYGGGGNSGATLKNDFIELYNGGAEDVDLTGWSVQYASAGGSSWQTTPLSGTIAVGHYYLIQEAAGTGGTVSLVPDATGTGSGIAMAGGAGKVALVSSTAPLVGTGCPRSGSPTIVDYVGYGNAASGGANCFEGTGATGTLSNTQSALRKDGGRQDTNDNAADFLVTPSNAVPTPRNSATTPLPPLNTLVISITPLGSTVDIGTPVNFTASAAKGGSIVAINTATWSSSNTAVASIDPASGLAMPLTGGSTTITVTAVTSAGTASASTTLSVNAPALPSDVIISQVYGGGGNNGATLRNDFIELYNGGTTPVTLDGWSVQYSSATAATWSTSNKTDLAGVIQPGHYFLIQEAAGAGGSADLPTADLIGSISVGGTSGKIALVRSTAVLTGPCPKGDATIADFVGYGLADCFRGSSATGVLTAATAALRRDYGRTNTNDNGADFEVADPTPRNSSQTPPPPGVAASVAVAPSFWSMRTTQTRTFSATARASDGRLITTPIVWSSSAPAVATVDATSGLVTARGLGTTTISATAPSGAVGTATVNVIIGNVTVQARDPLPVGFQAQLFLNTGSTDSNNGPVTNADITWSSSNPAVVSVTPANGLITAHTVGSAVITALSRTDGVSSGSTTIVTVDPVFSATARTGHNMDLGTPTDADASDDILITRREYTTSYNPRRGVTNWVSWNLDASHKGSLARCNCFTADTALVRLGFPAYDTNDWINNGTNGQYSRGHMSPSADWNISTGDNATTFYLTNMLPQNQEMNAGPWGKLEDYLRTRAVGTTEIYIVSGGIFTKDRRGPGVDGFGTISNAGKIAIPDSIWKVAVIVPDARNVADIGSPNDVEVIAINTPNQAPPTSTTPYTEYSTTIEKIQRSTGYDLLSALPEAVQCKLEQRNCAPSSVISGTGLAGGAEGSSLHFDASTSSDVDGTVQQYQWSIDGTVVGSGPTLDHVFADNGTYQVRLVVTDNGGASDVTTSSVSVSNVAPSIGALTGGTVNEGSAFTAAGSFVDPGDDSWNATVDYGDGSGVQPLTLAGKGFSLAHSYANNGSYTITVTVTETDAEGASGSQSTTVTVTNVAPVVATFDGATILRGETYASSGTFADPGADVWTATVNYGDGSGASALTLTGNAFALQHTYSLVGVQTVTVTVSDADGGSGTRTAQVTVLSSGQATTALASMVSALASSGSMEEGDAKWLANKLDVTGKELARGNDVAARNQLQQAIERIEAAQRAGRLSSTDAETLTSYATRILASMA